MPKHPKLWCDFTPPSSAIRAEVEGFLSPDIAIWPEDSEGVPNWFSWSSWHLEDAWSPQELVDRTFALKAVFDGAFYLTYGSKHHALKFHPVVGGGGLPVDTFLDPDLRAEPFSEAHITSRVDRIRKPASDIAVLIFLARYDEIAKQILKFLGVNGITYISLYALIDLMKVDWDEKRIAVEAGISHALFRDFKQTANNPTFLGPFCRHGGTDEAPQRPYLLKDAEGPILKAARSFLKDRANIAQLNDKWNAIAN